MTDFIVDWLELQKQTFPSIDGILILDDIVGFLGEQDFKQVAMPYLKRIFQKLQVNVKFFHNCVRAIFERDRGESFQLQLPAHTGTDERADQ